MKMKGNKKNMKIKEKKRMIKQCWRKWGEKKRTTKKIQSKTKTNKHSVSVFILSLYLWFWLLC
jgi:hypothetical protein